jgi:phosphoglycolate phosphatase-like HAD superfamily hydrolase
MTTLKVQAETGGFSLFVDTHHVVDELRLRNTALYNLITSSKFSSFRSDNGSFQPRPIYDERTGIFRYRFDDGIQLSASLVEQLPKLRNIFYQHAFAVELKPGQCYVADNHRFLHGHTSFTGSRELLRVLAHPHPALTRKFILFDVDGTLCRAEALSIDAYYRCITDASGREITHENTKVNLHGQTDVSLLHDILRYHNVPEAERDEVVKTFFDLHPQYLRDSLQKNGCDSIACPQVQEVLDWLPKESDSYGRPICIGLLTGNSKPNSLLKISAAGLSTNMFDLSISSFGDVHPTRTSLVRNSMRKIEAQHGIPIQPSDIVLIGDTPLDVQCARETGCRVVAVASGNYDKSSLIPFNPDFACDRLIEATDFLSTFLKASTE